MTQIVHKEVRKRGIFGWFFLILFLGFNLLMLAWAVAAGLGIGEMEPVSSDAEAAGRAVGSGIAFTIILVVWALGAIITGLLALLTRGSKTIVIEQ